MAEKDKIEQEKLSLRPNVRKRLYDEIHPSDGGDDSICSSLNHDESKSSSFSKKFLPNTYRNRDTESLDSGTFKTSLESTGLSDSIDSGNWNLSSPTSVLGNTSLPSLELNSIIQKYNDATLNSLNMSQMSYYSDNAITSPFPETFEMTSPSVSRNTSIASLEFNFPLQKDDNATLDTHRWSQTSMIPYSDTSITKHLTETVDMASLTSHASQTNSDENPCSFNAQSSNNLSSKSISETRDVTRSEPALDVMPSNDQSGVTSNKKTDKYTTFTTFDLEKNVYNENITSKQETVHQESKDIQKDSNKSDRKELHPHTEEDKTYSGVCREKSSKEPDCDPTLKTETNSDLKENYKTCKKNPGHETFYSPDELKVTNLPKDIQHEDSVTFFQCMSKLVIQISVTRTSDKRSEDDVYSSFIGTKKERNGSGFIVSTDNDMMEMKCARQDCPHNTQEDKSSKTTTNSAYNRNLSNMSTSSKSSVASTNMVKKHFIHGGVYIRTNRHVIFDKLEADNANVNFFFQSSDRKRIVQGHVASIHGVNNQQDHIVLHVMSHDQQLFNTINLHLKNAKSSYIQMVQSTHNTQQNHSYINKLSWVAVISHPHGTASSISFGRLRKEEMDMVNNRVIKYYDADTCPGSSGGLVITPTLLHLQWPGAVHSSFCSKTNYNVSLDSRFQELDASIIGQMTKKYLN